MPRMKGQVSLDYLAGALVFFSAVIILVSSVMGAIPQFKESQRRSQLELTGWAMSEVLLEDPGWWAQGTSNGTDWHTWPAGAEFVRVYGLEGPDGELSRAKIEALGNTPYQQLKARFDPGAEFNIGFTEFTPVDTYESFSPGNEPAYMTVDDDELTAAPVHYGSVRVGDEARYMLLIDEIGWYNKLMVSDDWDFADDARTYNLTRTRFIPIAGNTYQVEAARTEISDGKLLVLRRGMGRVGAVPPQNVGQIVSIQRYGVIDDRIIRMVVQLWQ